MTALPRRLRRSLISRLRRRRGFAMLEVTMALLLFAAAGTAGAYWINEQQQTMRAKIVGEQLATAGEAAERYLRDNWLDLLQTGGPLAGSDFATIDMLDLINEGYLPAGFGTNAYNQTLQLAVRKIPYCDDGSTPPACSSPAERRERVDGVVIARDGQDPTIDRKGAAIIAAGGMAGLVDTDDTPTTLSGAFGGWQADLTAYGLDADSNVRLGYALATAEDTVIDDFLYRAEVPGRPEANEMRADITFKQRPDGTTTGLAFDDPTAADSAHFRVTRDGTDDQLTFESDSGQGRFLFDGFETEVEIRGDTRLADGPGDVGGNLAVEGDTTLGEDGADTLIANATSTFTSDLTVGDDPADRLNVQSIADFDNTASFNDDVNIGVDGSDQLTVESTSTFNGETTINNALTVDAGPSDVSVNANLISLTGRTEIDGNTDVVVDCVNENLNVGLGPNIAGARTDACLRVGGSADVEGEIYGTGFFYDSDRRLKYDIEDVENALERIDALRAVNYKWRRDGGQDLGLIAQEVREVFPELVAADQNGMLSVKYGNLVAPLIAAVQELKQQNEELRARVDAATSQHAAFPPTLPVQTRR